MIDQDKSKQQLIDELAELRHRVAVLESAEGERQRSEERYRLLTEAVPQMLWRADANRQTIENNNRWYEYTGQSPEVARGLGWMKALHPEDVVRVTERVREALAAGEPYQAEYRVRRASDGAYRWHLSRALPMKGEDGQITGWFGSVTDIDDQKRAEEERDRGRAILSAVIECLPFEFFAIGPDGSYILQNAVLREHYGDAIGKRPEDYAPDEATLQLWLENNRRAFAGERVEGEVEAHVGGETRAYYNIISPIWDDGKVCGILGVNVDTTERKRAEDALQKAHDELEQRVLQRTAELAKANEALAEMAERLSLATSTANVGIWDLDIVNNKLVWDDSMFRLHGITPENFFGAYEAWQAGVHPEDLPQAEAYVQKAMRGEKEFDTEFRVVWPDKTVHWIKAHAAVQRDGSGRPVRMLGTNWDVTVRKLAEETLRESEQRLHAICDSALDAVVMVDSDGKAVYWNPAAEKMFGYSCQEMLGRDVHGILTPDRYCEQAIDGFNDFRISGQGRAVGNVLELAALRKDGTEFPIEIAVSGFKMAEKWCAAAIIRDVTGRKKAP